MRWPPPGGQDRIPAFMACNFVQSIPSLGLTGDLIGLGTLLNSLA